MSHQGPPGPPAGMASCARHPDRATNLACSRCRRPACVECLREAPVGYQCVDCVSAGKPAAPRAAQQLVAPQRRTPYLTYALIALNVAAFVATAVQAHSIVDNQQSQLFADWALIPEQVAGGQWFRLVGSGFLHFGPLHLLMNMWCLYVCGQFVEQMLGRVRFLALYLVSLLGGSAAVMMFSHNAATAGASGAIFGLFGIQAVILLRLRANVGMAVAVIVVNLVFSFSIPGIAIWGHVGGLVCGTLAGAGMLYGPQLVGDRSGARPTGRAVAWGAVAAIALIAVAAIAIEVNNLRAAVPVG